MKNTTNKLKLVQMLRLRPDKNVTRSKMYIRDPNGGYMKRLDPKTGEEENYTLKRLLLDIKYKAIHKPPGAERSLNEYLIRIVFNHEVVMKSALKSIKDPGHEDAIDAIHGYLSKHEASSLDNRSGLPKHDKIMSDFDVILKLKNKYHKTTYLDKDDTYIQEDKLIRENDIQLDDVTYVSRKDDSIFGINSAVNIYSRMKKLYADLQEVLLQYSGNDIIFNKYTVTGRDDGKGKMNEFEEKSKKLIETIQEIEAGYVYFLSDFNNQAKEIMKQIHTILKGREPRTLKKKQSLQGVMLSLGENIKILDHYIKIFFNEINSSRDSVKEAIRRQNDKSKVSPKGYGPKAPRTFSSISSGIPTVKKEEDDDFYKGMNMMSLSPTTIDGKSKTVETEEDKETLAFEKKNSNTRKKKKKKKKKNKNKTRKSGKNEDFDNLIAQAMKSDSLKEEAELKAIERAKTVNTEILVMKMLSLQNDDKTHFEKEYNMEFEPTTGYVGNYIKLSWFKDAPRSKKIIPHGLGFKLYDDNTRVRTGLINYIGSWWRGKEDGFGQLTYNNEKEGMMVYRGNFSKGKRWGEGEVYIMNKPNKVLKGLFLDEKLIKEQARGGGDSGTFIPQQTWEIMKKYYWILRLYHSKEDFFKGSNPYDILQEIKRSGQLPIAHISFKNDEINFGMKSVVNVIIPILINFGKLEPDYVQFILEFLENSYRAYLIIVQQIKYDGDENSEKDALKWWAENGWGLHGKHMQFKPNITPFDSHHHWIFPGGYTLSKDMGILDMLFQGSETLLKDFYKAYFKEIPVEGVVINISHNDDGPGYILTTTRLPTPPGPVTTGINIYQKEERRKLDRLARGWDTYMEKEIEIHISNERKEMKKYKKSLNPKLLEKYRKMDEMILNNINKISDLLKGTGEYNDDEIDNTLEKLITMHTAVRQQAMSLDMKNEDIMKKQIAAMGTVYALSIEILKPILKLVKDIEEKKERMKKRRVVKVKKKGGRRTRKKRGSSRAEVCSQLLERLKMINTQIELGGFDIDELKNDYRRIQEILKKCLNEGLIDITEYMKIKMEYENYFKQY